MPRSISNEKCGLIGAAGGAVTYVNFPSGKSEIRNFVILDIAAAKDGTSCSRGAHQNGQAGAPDPVMARQPITSLAKVNARLTD
ncbi:MAG: hypothetical protein J5858_05875 [Lentisphaeria bacterium]|nr:hypothetical protein [Lentisphaeria bacterium]